VTCVPMSWVVPDGTPIKLQGPLVPSFGSARSGVGHRVLTTPMAFHAPTSPKTAIPMIYRLEQSVFRSHQAYCYHHQSPKWVKDCSADVEMGQKLTPLGLRRDISMVERTPALDPFRVESLDPTPQALRPPPRFSNFDVDGTEAFKSGRFAHLGGSIPPGA